MRFVACFSALYFCRCADSNLEASGNNCINAAGLSAPCGPGNDQCDATKPISPKPNYHVQDFSCGENDPNGPCYDPSHGVYHLFYQDHVPGGIVWGHVVSRDMTHWARMPVAIWHDQSYDSHAIFSGSCLSVDGRMTIVYPGVCRKGDRACETGTTIALAFPSNSSDPLATNFSKPSYNPIAQVNASVGPGGGGPPGGGGDPSAPWRTESGEWRIATRASVTQVVWGSMDFKSWYWIGPQRNFPQGACPSFFTLPKRTPGALPPAKGAEDPTHVYMWGDTVYAPPKTHRVGMIVGSYVDNGIRVAHSFEATPGVARGLEPFIADNGTYYAAKDFYDPVKDRRILWGWAQIPKGAQTMPREVTWHPQLQQLVFSPLEEQAELRASPKLANFSGVELAAGTSFSLGNWPGSVGNQAEVAATFVVPTRAATFGIGMLTHHGAPTYEAYVDFRLADSSIQLGLSGSWQVSVGIRKRGTTADKACTSGVKGRQTLQSCEPEVIASTLLSLLPSDQEIEIRVYTDNVIAEIYFINGRVALTVPVTTTEEAGFTIFSSQEQVVSRIDAWRVNPIWVTQQEVLDGLYPQNVPTELLI